MTAIMVDSDSEVEGTSETKVAEISTEDSKGAEIIMHRPRVSITPLDNKREPHENSKHMVCCSFECGTMRSARIWPEA